MTSRLNSTRPTRLAAAILAAVLAELFPAAAEPSLADYYVNGAKRGTVELEIGPDGRVMLPRATIRYLLDGAAKPSAISAAAILDRSMRSREVLFPGIVLSYDPASLTLRAEIDPKAMPESTIPVVPEPDRKQSGISVPNSPVSATIGLNLSYDPSVVKDETGARVVYNEASMDLAPAIRVFGVVLEGRGRVSYGPAGLARSLDGAQAIVDFPGLGYRLKAGMVDAGGAPYQSSARIYGLAIGRERSLPGSIMERAAADDRILIRHQADLSIAVNGVVIRRLRLQPGDYRFSDLPLATGLNEVEIVIAEQGEPVRTVRVGIPFDESILPAGVADVGLALGSAEPDRPAPFGSTRLAVGVGREIQLGVDAEADGRSFLGGLSFLAASALGNLGFQTSTSTGYRSLPNAAPSSYAARAYWRWSQPRVVHAPSLGLVVEYRARGFAAPGDGAPEGPGSWNLSGQVGQNLPGRAGSVTLSGQGAIEGTSLGGWSTAIGLSLPMQASSFFSISAGYEWKAGEGASMRASLSLTLSTSGRGFATFNQGFSNGVDSESLSYHQGSGGGASMSFSGQGLADRGADKSVDLALTRRDLEAGITASGRYLSGADGTRTEIGGRLAMATTLAIADGAIAATSSPGSALAFVVPSRELAGHRVEVRPSAGAPSFTGDSGTGAMINGVSPYVGYSAGIDLPGSGLEVRPYPSAVRLSPAYRSVSVVKVGRAPSITVKGRLVDATSRPVAGMQGDLIDDRGEIIPLTGIFTDEDGVFECYDLSVGTHRIMWSDGSVVAFSVTGATPGSTVTLTVGGKR